MVITYIYHRNIEYRSILSSIDFMLILHYNTNNNNKKNDF